MRSPSIQTHHAQSAVAQSGRSARSSERSHELNRGSEPASLHFLEADRDRASTLVPHDDRARLHDACPDMADPYATHRASGNGSDPTRRVATHGVNLRGEFVVNVFGEPSGELTDWPVA